MSSIRIAELSEILADISDRQAVYQYVHEVVDNDDEPTA